jgi:hypothetical protein
MVSTVAGPVFCFPFEGFDGQAMRGVAWEQVPLVASNRIGKEEMSSGHITFYGGSFISGPTGDIRAQVCGFLFKYIFSP